jgi:zinc transport system substrate-binding protein
MLARLKRLAFIAALFFAVALRSAEAPPRVITSFFPLYCWTANVVGDHAQVECLLPARAEPHDYAFTPGDARRLHDADLIVVNGLTLEGWLPKFLRGAPDGSSRVVNISTGMGAQLIEGGHEHHHHEHSETKHANPHVWLDPVLAAHGVSNILAALQRISPRDASTYASNAQIYVGKLHQLDRDIRAGLAGMTDRTIVTYHDAFPYFARRYGFEIAGVVEEVPEVNPTPKYLARLSRLMRERNIRVIFVAAGGRTRLAERIAADLRVKLVELDTLETGPLHPAAYEERMRHNLSVLQQQLR